MRDGARRRAIGGDAALSCEESGVARKRGRVAAAGGIEGVRVGAAGLKG